MAYLKGVLLIWKLLECSNPTRGLGGVESDPLHTFSLILDNIRSSIRSNSSNTCLSTELFTQAY